MTKSDSVMKRFLMMFLPVIWISPASAASLNDIWEGIGNSLSKLWHHDIVIPEPVQHIFLLTVFGVFGLFVFVAVIKTLLGQIEEFKEFLNDTELSRFWKIFWLVWKGFHIFIFGSILLIMILGLIGSVIYGFSQLE